MCERSRARRSATPTLRFTVCWGLSCPCYDKAWGGKRLAIQTVSVKTRLSHLQAWCLFTSHPPPTQWSWDLPARPTEKGPTPCSLWAYGQWTSAHPHRQAYCYFARSRLLSPDKQRRAEDRKKQSSAQPISSVAGFNNDNTTRLSPLIKGYKQHPRQAMAFVECCTSVTQNKRQAGIIRVATLVHGTTCKSKSKPQRL